MILLLILTLPVALGILAAGHLGARRGPWAVWGTLAATELLTALVIGRPWHVPSGARSAVLGLVALYTPALGLGGLALMYAGRPRWHPVVTVPVAVGAAVLNLLLAPAFFTVGCALGRWECP